MDELDQDILDLLREDGRMPFTRIAEKLEVSEGTVRHHVEAMLEEGIIERFTVDVGWAKELQVVVMASVAPGKPIADIIENLPQDCMVDEVTGEWDLIIRFGRESSEGVNTVLEAIRKVEGVEGTETFTVLASHTR